MELTPVIRDRIYEAADQLYGQGGRQTFPTVDAVRKHARVNMNDASVGMRSWRRLQTSQLDVPAVQVPATLQQASTTLLQSLWNDALTLANETLRAAQAGWDADRANLETVSEQMASAYEAQSLELATATAETERIKQDHARLLDAVATAQRLAEDSVTELMAARAATAQEEARGAEIERRADDLRLALGQAHASHMAAVDEYVSRIRSQEAEIDALRSDLARVPSKDGHLDAQVHGNEQAAEKTPH